MQKKEGRNKQIALPSNKSRMRISEKQKQRPRNIQVISLFDGKGHNARTLATIVFGLHRSIQNITKRRTASSYVPEGISEATKRRTIFSPSN
uniref:Uncharacterized protein n=1 Tax=Salix viminalis TaxID=40686 RepID=A0A6N2K4I9_SALVM